jgi:hypothetical protein
MRVVSLIESVSMALWKHEMSKLGILGVKACRRIGLYREFRLRRIAQVVQETAVLPARNAAIAVNVLQRSWQLTGKVTGQSK